ncbi:hypothetical protein GCM10017771_84600 [Streptomyces capitiformicae]|uniref:Uncharacterized protein n=1 Tax=Streptomyces capitiformicae TaxID=2014920 RepID=A0A919DLU4_9ACTN|nr:hypothetical protein GCM10017771_84600 [Streptomyces capitiformicae]
MIIEGSQTSRTLGDTPLLLPDPSDKLARRLLARGRGRVSIGASSDSPWLLPGAFAGHHLNNEHLGTQLKRLGISPETATTCTQSGGHWSRYAAELKLRFHNRRGVWKGTERGAALHPVGGAGPP